MRLSLFNRPSFVPLFLAPLSVAACQAGSAAEADSAAADMSTDSSSGSETETATDTGTETDTDSGTDTAPDPDPEFGEPIEIPPEQLEQWVWIAMPEMLCSDGTEGGFAVNFTDASRELVVYLQGGGICYDTLTCAVGGAPTSVGADPLNTALDASIREHRGIFDRRDPSNPFRDSNFVVVPHCTGDHHTGNRVANYGGTDYHHVGYTNITHMLDRVVPTFSDATRVVLSGFSAGGVGITANYHQLASALESIDLPSPYLLIDSGPFMRPPFLETSAQATLRTNWGLDGTIGTFCPSCLSDGFHDLYRVNASLHPGLRSSLICAYEDNVVVLLYTVLNGGNFNAEQMRQGLHDLADWGETTESEVAPSTHRVFYYESDRHGALNVAALSATPGLAEFLEAQLGAGDWESVRP